VQQVPSVIPLLITWRSRSLAASGARVKPVLRTFLTSSTNSRVRVPTAGKEKRRQSADLRNAP